VVFEQELAVASNTVEHLVFVLVDFVELLYCSDLELNQNDAFLHNCTA
jgi:hypothetical protein